MTKEQLEYENACLKSEIIRLQAELIEAQEENLDLWENR